MEFGDLEEILERIHGFCMDEYLAFTNYYQGNQFGIESGFIDDETYFQMEVLFNRAFPPLISIQNNVQTGEAPVNWWINTCIVVELVTRYRVINIPVSTTACYFGQRIVQYCQFVQNFDPAAEAECEEIVNCMQYPYLNPMAYIPSTEVTNAVINLYDENLVRVEVNKIFNGLEMPTLEDLQDLIIHHNHENENDNDNNEDEDDDEEGNNSQQSISLFLR